MSSTELPVEVRSHRFLELDSLRGLAAGCVVFWHFLLLWRTEPEMKWARRLPTNLFYNGPAAVILFFVLSGFVLSLPFLKEPQGYFSYLVKRACRIYLPYAAGLLLSVAACAWTPPLYTGNFWLDTTWNVRPSLSLVLHHLSGIGNFHPEQFNTAYWTLVIEMRISILFPAIIWLTRRISLWMTFGLSLLIALLLTGEDRTTLAIALFLNGSALAVHFETIVHWWRSLPRTAKLAIAGVAYFLYFYPILQLRLQTTMLGIELTWWGISLASILFIVLATQHLKLRHFLHSPVVLRLGMLSYSIYLVHGTVLFTLTHLYWNKVGRMTLLLPYLVLTYVLAEAMHAFVEKPSMLLGRRLGKMLR